MTEQELVEKLAQAEDDLKHAKRNLADAKKRWTEAETTVIEVRLLRDRTKEALREHRATIPSLQPEITLRQREIDRFRAANPELCAEARKRDLDKP